MKKNYKYFIGYLCDDYKIEPLHTAVLPKVKVHVKSYNGQTKWMPFLIENNDLLEKYNTIWNKVSTDIKKKIDSKSVYNNTFLKTTIKSYGDEATGFRVKETAKVGSDCTCLVVITIDSAFDSASII